MNVILRDDEAMKAATEAPLAGQAAPAAPAMGVPAVLRAVNSALDRQTRWMVWLVCAVTLVLSVTTDIATGSELAWSIFYVVPVAIAAWHLGWRPALGVVAVAAAGWLFASHVTDPVFAEPAARYWNTLVRTGFFLIIARSLTVLKAVMEHANAVSRTDWLTGLPNSRSFLESAIHEVERSRRTLAPLTVAYIDVDGFKAVNDTFGHAAGDNLLRQIAGTLRGSLRVVDLVARLGGDEFAVLLPGADRQQAGAALDRLHAELQSAATAGGWPVSVSIGAVVFGEAPSVEDMLRQADIAMYAAKRAGGGRTRFEEAGAGEAGIPGRGARR